MGKLSAEERPVIGQLANEVRERLTAEIDAQKKKIEEIKLEARLEANRLGVEFAKRFTKGNHAFVVCTHIDKSHIHNHIIWSSVSLEYDRKFRNFWGSTKAVRQLSDTICI